ncbi:MAG TPA: FAD-dependent oxidoreductase [Methylomirabilota bacterium]|nr:FAD-dependent oxidoreductase [Methylomirabilota bacterium]
MKNSRKSVGKTALIIGGGIAGLSAAAELLRCGWQITLVEAKPRLGGRIHTLNCGKVPIELGAEFVHGDNKTLAKTICDAGLSTHSVSNRNRILKDGRLKSVQIWERVSAIVKKIDPRAPDQTFSDFLEHAKVRAVDRQIATGFVEGFNAADAQHISAHALLRAEASASRSGGSEQSRLDAGYGALIDWFANKVRECGGILLMSSQAQVLKWKPNHVELLVQRGRSKEVFTAHAAVITLPLGVLKAGVLRFEPSLTHKRDAIEHLLFGNAVRLTLRFREAWWPKKNFGFVHSYDDALPTWWSDPRGPILTGWAGGSKADSLANCSGRKLRELSLGILAKIFGRSANRLAKQVESAHMHNWSCDPYALGAYSYLPVNGLDLPKLLAEPLAETLYFAGESTAMDGQMGTVFGALESGLRAAKEIVE